VVTDVFRLLVHVADILEGLGIRYVVGGSLASGAYGELRATNDVDILVEIPRERVAAFVAALEPTFDIWEDTVQDAVEAGRSFSAVHIEWHVKVDFFPAGSSPLDARELERRRAVRLPAAPEREVYITTPEDIVLRKLEWFRRSHGVLERQLRDVVGVLKVQGASLEHPYLRGWAVKLGVQDLLDRCMEDAGLAP
jgi:hypothetical protein